MRSALMWIALLLLWTALNSSSASPASICIAEFQNGTFKLNLNELETLLLQPHLKDKPISLVSIVGGARTGKSFLLNFEIMNLRARTNGSAPAKGLNGTNWMTNADLRRFHSAPGSTPVTTGMNIYPEPFIVKDDNDNDVVVLLMDTQGTFNEDTTVNDCATIFALTALLSSHMIFNEMRLFQEFHYQHLRLSVEIAKTFADKAIYESLTFLARDAELDGIYGQKAGAKFFKDHIMPNWRQSMEGREIRKAINASFNRLDAFLLPHPGDKVSAGTFQTIDDIDKTFLYYVAEFLENIPILPKQLDNETVTCEEWLQYLKFIGKLIEEDTINIKGFYETTRSMNMYMAKSRIIKEFEEKVKEEAYKENGNADAVIKLAIKAFTKSRVLGGVDVENKDELKQQLEAIAQIQHEKGKSDRAYAEKQLELEGIMKENKEIEERNKEILRQKEEDAKAHEEKRKQMELEAAAKQQELERALQDKTKSEEEKRAIAAQHEADRLRFEAERERMRQESEQRRRDQDLLMAQIQTAAAENGKLFAQLQADRNEQAKQQQRLQAEMLKAQQRHDAAQKAAMEEMRRMHEATLAQMRSRGGRRGICAIM